MLEEKKTTDVVDVANVADVTNVIIGLEIHVQLKTESKLFCDCPTNYLSVDPNTNICEVCTAQPGSKPFSINETAIENALKIAIALNCQIEKEILVQRKHYFYPDLPPGYQRTSKPIGVRGKLGNIRIREIHFEEDPGRYELRRGTVDFNRAGIPLLEIVTEPDFKSPEEARKFLDELSAILQYLEAAREEPGSSRIDANISLPKGARVEIKNINSFKGVYTALTYEIVRQQNLLMRGKFVDRETRHFDEAQGITIGLRKKEREEDYRYFPDPDVPPVFLSEERIEKIKTKIPELPRAKAERFISQYKIREEDAMVIVSEAELADLFEKMSKKFDPQKVVFWLRGPLKKQLNYRNLTFKNSGLKEEDLSEIFDDFYNGRITDDSMENALITMLDNKVRYKELKPTLEKITNVVEIEKVVDEVIKKNEKAINDYKLGEERALNFLIGTIVKKFEGKVDSRIVRELILKKIK